MTTDTMPTALRVVADLIEAHPDLPRPCVWGYGNSGTVEVQWQLLNSKEPGVRDDQRAAASAIMRAVGGKWDKDASDDRFYFEQKRDRLTLQILATVIIPAVEAQPERTETRAVVEWRCEPVLA